MDYTKLSRKDLLQKCAELQLTKYKSKTKSQLIELLNQLNESEIDCLTKMKLDLDIEKSINIIDSRISLYEKDETYLNDFLKSLRNKNGNYKRICISPLRYAGGKSKEIGIILENLPKLKKKKNSITIFWWGFSRIMFITNVRYRSNWL